MAPRRRHCPPQTSPEFTRPVSSTTHPLAISVIARLLEDRGAKVIIGDQSGIEHVLHHKRGVIRGSSRENYARSGMGIRDDPRFISFEDGGWDEGFFHYQSENTRSWKASFFITTWAEKADHIICLPRVSAHSQAGASLGLKCMVGMLREDSRMEFHANGPYNRFITGSAKGSTLVSEDDGSGKFLEKIVEISDVVRKKLRLTLFAATKAQTTFGPDQYAIRVGPVGFGRASVVSPRPGLVFASADPVAAEAFALALLKDLKTVTPSFARLSEQLMLYQNPNVQELPAIAVRDHPTIRHATAIGLGEMPYEVVYADVPGVIQDRLNQYLK